MDKIVSAGCSAVSTNNEAERGE